MVISNIRNCDYTGSNKTMITVGGDAGNRLTKLAALFPGQDNKWKLATLVMPSKTAQGFPQQYEYLEGGYDDIIFVSDGRGSKYIIDSPAGIATGSAYYQSSKERAALIYAGITKIIGINFKEPAEVKKPIPVQLSLTTMTGHYYAAGQKKDDLHISQITQAMIGQNFSLLDKDSLKEKDWPKIVYAGNTEVVAETLAAALHVLLDDNGKPRLKYENDKPIRNGDKLLIVDVGNSDTTLLDIEVKGGLPKMIDFITSTEVSVEKTVANPLAKLVKMEVQKAKKTIGRQSADSRIASGQELLMMRERRIYDNVLDLMPLKRGLINSLTSAVNGLIASFVSDADEYAAVVLVGGYVPLAMSVFDEGYFLRDGDSQLDKLHNILIPEDPEMANAYGALKAALYRNSRNSK